MINRRNFLSRSVLAATCAATGISSSQPYDPRFKGVELLPFQKQIVKWMDSRQNYLQINMTRTMGATFIASNYQKNRERVGIIVDSSRSKRNFIRLGCRPESIWTLSDLDSSVRGLRFNTVIVDCNKRLGQDVIMNLICPLRSIREKESNQSGIIQFVTEEFLLQKDEFSFENKPFKGQELIIVNSDSKLIPEWMRQNFNHYRSASV